MELDKVEIFWARIHKLRIDKNVSNDVVQKALGMARNRLASLKAKDYYPSIEELVKLADYFNVSTDYLLSGKCDSTISTKVIERLDKTDSITRTTVMRLLGLF